MKTIAVFIVIFFLSQAGYCQVATDSSSNKKSDPSYFLEFLGGHIAYSIFLFAPGGSKLLSHGDANYAAGAIVGVFASGVAVGIIGNISSGRDVLFLWSLGGAILGAFIGLPITGYAFIHETGSIVRYLALSLPPILGSMLCYSFGVNIDKHDSNSKSMFISPVISKDWQGISFKYAIQ